MQPTTSLNTWNGPILFAEGKYHMYLPLYAKGSLTRSTEIMHGVADKITGPYDWFARPRIQGSSNCMAAVFNDTDGKTKYTLWSKGKYGGVQIADSPDGPFRNIPNSTLPHDNVSPLFHNGSWYLATDHNPAPGIRKIWTTKELGKGTWAVHAHVDQSGVEADVRVEDPFLFVDRRNNWHIIGHAFRLNETEHCGGSRASAHYFSADAGQSWHMLVPNVEPYSHTVRYADGSSHTYATLERPFCHFDENGVMTHISLAADMVTQDSGCANYSKHDSRACTNCKYADHAGTIIVALGE